MAERLHRTQVLLEPEQHEALADLARQEGTSIAAALRKILRGYFGPLRPMTDEEVKQGLEAIESLRKFHEEILAERGGKPIDLDVNAILDEMRQEQDERNTAGLIVDIKHRD